jgi:hypothetical protein
VAKNRRITRGRRSSHLVLVVLLLFATSCEKYTRYPPGTWSNFDSSASERWRIKTTEEVYLVRRFATTDSTVVIEELSQDDERYNLAYRDATLDTPHHGDVPALELPIAMSLAEVTSIERIGHDRVKEGFLVVGLTAVAVVAVLAFGVFVFSHADWQ